LFFADERRVSLIIKADCRKNFVIKVLKNFSSMKSCELDQKAQTFDFCAAPLQ